ncbi:MAG: DNA repair protein RadC [Verrucomicrobia bacterium]|nr:DNA repair protein RadC [Verrucomicrobiota bacterium]
MMPPDSYQSPESEPPESASPANERPPVGQGQGLSASDSPRIHDLPEDERPREKMAARGPQALTDAELLAIFLGTGTLGKSAIDVGRDLLRDVGSLTGLSRRSLTELRKVKGIGFAKAVNLSATFELGRRLAREKFAEQKVDSPEAVYELLGPEMRLLSKESLRVLLLNTRHHLIRIEEVSLGSLNECIAHPREIMHSCVAHSAYGFILAHNHPSGDPSPSRADRDLTRRIAEAANILQIKFLDHVIVGSPTGDEDQDREPYFSFREMGLM